MTMNESHVPSRRRERAKSNKTEEVIGSPLEGGELAGGGDDAPVELDAYDDDRPVESEPDYDEDFEPAAEYDEESESESEFDSDYDYDEESEEIDFGPGHHPHPGHGPEPRLAPGPKHGRGHQLAAPHEHGPGPKKALAKKAAGPKKHSGHPPPPPHEHGPGHGLRGPAHEPDFGLGPGTGFSFGPVPGFGFGPGARGRRRESGRRGRRGRPGDVRAALLTLLAERPMHGYEMIQEIAERSQDLWRPSPGSVYPTLQLLDDEGLIVGTQSEGSKKLFELTDDGHAAAEKVKTPPWEQIAAGIDDLGQVDLRAELGQLIAAVAQSTYAATVEQQQRIHAILKNARRAIYTLLAESD